TFLFFLHGKNCYTRRLERVRREPPSPLFKDDSPAALRRLIPRARQYSKHAPHTGIIGIKLQRLLQVSTGAGKVEFE
ncbi:MAG: hypothetical protein LBF83_03665, partial [Spirochaetaceae bacterium]|nr:hypothetical protein [Spirochaetaceae bacterium]